MSLRMFHLVFVSMSVILAAFVAAWAAGQYQLEHETVYALTCVLALAGGAMLAVYGAAFRRKTQHL